jgi:hypothetical protein
MGCCIEKLIFKRGVDKINKEDVASELWRIPIKDIDGRDTTLEEYTKNKKAFIFVNVACK